jgi:long-chain fatty acid transport protein
MPQIFNLQSSIFNSPPPADQGWVQRIKEHTIWPRRLSYEIKENGSFDPYRGRNPVGICTDLADAGALYIYEMANPSDVGYAGAGLAVRAEDAGTVFTNPAGMTRIKKSVYQAGVQPLYIDGNWDSDNTTTATGPDKGVFEFFSGAAFSYTRPVGDKLRLGISAQNYFGLALKWDNDWVGRYEITKSALIAPQLQPTVAYQVFNWLSIGAGAGLTLGVLADEAKVKNWIPV